MSLDQVNPQGAGDAGQGSGGPGAFAPFDLRQVHGVNTDRLGQLVLSQAPVVPIDPDRVLSSQELVHHIAGERFFVFRQGRFKQGFVALRQAVRHWHIIASRFSQ